MGNNVYKLISAGSNQWTSNAYHECASYKIYVPAEIIDYHLPKKFMAFSPNTRVNSIRRFYFFSEQAAGFTRFLFDDYMDRIPSSVSFDYFLRKLSKEKDFTIRYNFVIMNDYLIFIRAPIYPDRAYRSLCKHITISRRAPYARFAGEIWYNGYGYFVVNNNSGTYQPSDSSIIQVIRMFKSLSPNVHFRGVSFRVSAPSSFNQYV